MKKECYIVIFSSYSEELDAYAFWSKDNARQSVREDADTEMISLREEGYNPILLERAEDHLELYVPGIDIYFEWHVTPSTVE